MAEETASSTTSTDLVPWYKKLKNTKELEVLTKPWYIVACVRHWLYGETTASIAKTMGKSPSQVADVFKSPAARRLRDYLSEQVEDPVAFAREVVRASALGVTLDWYMAMEWAKEARDYKNVASMAKDLAALGGIQPEAPKPDKGVQTLRIVLDSKDLNSPAVETSWEILDDDDS